MQKIRPKPVAGVGAVVLALASAFTIDLTGLVGIQRHEGTRTSAYLDAVNVPTICTGSTRGVYIGQRATLAECEHRLREDTSDAGAAVSKHVHVKLTQQQYNQLVSLTFNIGGSALGKSTLVRKLNAGDCYGAGAEFHRWVYAGKTKLRGLVVRRAEESRLFTQDCVYWENHGTNAV